MSDTQSSAIDFTQNDEVLLILPRSPLRTSAGLGWNGIHVQQHQQPPWETPEYAHTRHMLLIHHTDVTVRSERWFDGRMQQEDFGGNTNIVILPAAVPHRANWNRESPFSLIFFEPDRLSQVAYESVSAEHVELIAQHAMHDPFIDQIGRSLIAELETSQINGRLFADSLTTALSIHLLRHYSNWQRPLREYAEGLPRRKLQQAIDYVNEYSKEDLTVSAIAHELEMSQYYFSRLFKQSMGLSPYQYVIQQRIGRAKSLLRTTSLSVAAIAVQSGFSNQNQLTVQFRKFAGTTPSHYRKGL